MRNHRMSSRGKISKQLEALGDEDPIVRRQAARKLGKSGASSAVEPLCIALQDKSWFVRRNAAKSLGHLGDPTAVASLCAALTDKSQGVRREAIIALGEIADSRAIEPLCAMLASKKAGIYLDAQHALVCIGLPAIGPLCRSLVHENSILVEHASTTLAELHYRSGQHCAEALPATAVLYAIVGAENLTPQQRWLGLETVRRQRPAFTLPDYFGDASRFCQGLTQHTDSPQLRENARAIFEFITLARPGAPGGQPYDRTLLRAAAPGKETENANVLLRGSVFPSVQHADVLSWPKRLWEKVRGKKQVEERNEEKDE